MIFFYFLKIIFFRSERETDSSKRDYDSRPAKRSLLLLQRTNTEFEITIFIVHEKMVVENYLKIHKVKNTEMVIDAKF